MGTNRCPKNLHGQAEALLGGVGAIGRKTGSVDRRFIRGIGTWDVYRRDIQRFIEFLQRAAPALFSTSPTCGNSSQLVV